MEELTKSLDNNFIDDDTAKSILHVRPSEPTKNNLNDLSPNLQEKFDKVIRALILADDDPVAAHSSFIFSCSNITDINLS